MRIANVMRRIAFDEWGGTETAVWNSSLKLKEAGHSVEILATTALCGLGQEEREGLPVRRFDYF
ncbi:MAG: glycosyltransferase family 1 protein, partial [Verrucomicrobia bacterium]|nr:glycosyltransferase family 1 protein [Verrucomicrobiota bacterium]